jgi:hypothetical protein
MARQTEEENEFEERMKVNEARQLEMNLPREKRAKHWSGVGGVANLTFENISPKPKPQGWICLVKGCDGQKKKLLPVSQDIPPEYWQCTKCQRTITIVERDNIFEAIRQQVIDKYQLKTFEYDKEKDIWEIILSEWIGQSRIGSKRRQLTAGMRQELKDELLNNIEDTLSIHINSIKEYFLES